MFRVIETTEGENKFVTAVPKIWVVGSTLLWPNTKKDCRKQCVEPSEDWRKLPCKIIFDDIDSWEKALEKEREAEFLSSDDTGFDELSKLPEAVIDDLNDLMTEIVSEKMCDPPQMRYGTSRPTLSYDSNFSDQRAALQAIQDVQAEQKASLQAMEMALLDQKKLLEQFIAKTEVSLNLIIEKLCVAVERTDLEAVKIPENLLPIATQQQMDELEEKIGADPAFKRALIRKLSTFGGVSASKNIRTISRCAFSDELLAEYSWFGTATKKKFEGYKNIFAVVVEAVRERFPSFSDVEGSTYFKVYLKQARFRLGKNPLDDSAVTE